MIRMRNNTCLQETQLIEKNLKKLKIQEQTIVYMKGKPRNNVKRTLQILRNYDMIE